MTWIAIFVALVVLYFVDDLLDWLDRAYDRYAPVPRVIRIGPNYRVLLRDGSLEGNERDGFHWLNGNPVMFNDVVCWRRAIRRARAKGTIED